MIAQLLRFFDPEDAHHIANKLISYLPDAKSVAYRDASLCTQCFGLQFSNPLGIAAGFDKNALCFRQLPHFGFGHIEIGTVTPKPQLGNERPRVFRLNSSHAIVNRLGFPNDGMFAIEARLQSMANQQFKQNCASVVGINIGCNAEATDRVNDYLILTRQLGQYGDYIAINVSSPNTKNLRQLQTKDHLQAIVNNVREELDKIGHAQKPVLVKVSPDIDSIDELGNILLATKPDGVIVSNTTIMRPQASTMQKNANEKGGLSGPPLFKDSTILLAKLYIMCADEMFFIGVGGVKTGLDAYLKICAGASLVQLYTALIWEGPFQGRRILQELAFILQQKEQTLTSARGSMAKEIASGYW